MIAERQSPNDCILTLLFTSTENSSKTKTQAKITFPNDRKGTLWIYGDSLALRLHNSLSSKLLCTKIFRACSRSYNWVYPIPYESEYVAKTKNDNFDFRPNLVLESIREVLLSERMTTADSLLVLNLGLHFPIGINFTTYQNLITDVIRLLRNREKELGSKARVIWKTMTAIHKEKVAKPRNKTHWRFFTDQVNYYHYFPPPPAHPQLSPLYTVVLILIIIRILIMITNSP